MNLQKRMNMPANIEQLGSNTITELMYQVWKSRADLQKAFDLSNQQGQEDFIYWCKVSVKREYGFEINFIDNGKKEKRYYNSKLHKSIFRLLTLGKKLKPYIPGTAYNSVKKTWYAYIEPYTLNFHKKNFLSKAMDAVPKGANLVGYARAELGMGEHVRMAAAAFNTTKADFAVIDYNFGVASRQKAEPQFGQELKESKYRANIFHINADQMLPAYLYLGEEFFANRYNIGYWAWELPNCPKAWYPAINFVDEIWAPSKFIQEAFTPVTDKPVVHMPLCQEIPEIKSLPKSTFGIPEDSFMFLYSFDFFSYLDRKNPYAAIKAFKKAFPNKNTRVSLVIKLMNGTSIDTRWKKMMHLIGGDKRIIILNKTMDKGVFLSLKKACDCYVSLHRSEGFGRAPFEAMYLGKPVIVTNYSGNTDFTLKDNSCLVDYELIEVKEGEYPFYEDQVWADPDIEQAAWFMKKIFSDRDFAAQLGTNAAEYVKVHYNPEVIGKRYFKRLRELNLI